MIQEDYGVTYSYSYMTRFLRTKFNAKFAKPYPRDYRQSPYYKSSFYLKLYHIFKKYNLKYDIETESIINLDTNEPFLIFSFDESAFQFTANNVHLWSLYKPQIEKDTTHFKCKVSGAYSFCKNGKDDLIFLENSTKESIANCLESLREKNPVGEILLLIDNFRSHISTVVKEKAEELNISLCYLPSYSPQLQPEEKIWKENKRDIALYKVNTISNYEELNKNEREDILNDLVETSFYENVKSKNKWNKVLNNYFKPIIKLLNPEHNAEWEVQKIS